MTQQTQALLNNDKVIAAAQDALLDCASFLGIEIRMERVEIIEDFPGDQVRIGFLGHLVNPPLEEPYSRLAGTVNAHRSPDSVRTAVRRRFMNVISIQTMKEAPFVYAVIDAFKYNNQVPLLGLAMSEIDMEHFQGKTKEKDLPPTRRIVNDLLDIMRKALVESVDLLREAYIESFHTKMQ